MTRLGQGSGGETGKLFAPALVVHGGAGRFEQPGASGGGEARKRLEGALGEALGAGWEILNNGGGAIRAVVEAVASMEDSGAFNAGRGSRPTTEGAIETDAAVMDGATRRAGAVCAATWPANPVRVALLVARSRSDTGAGEGPETTPWTPLLIAAAGADRLARSAGLIPLALGSPKTATTGDGDTRRHDHRESAADSGTVGAVALDAAGHVAAATSTGGRAGQPPGRVGDSAIIGAGTWADDTTVAVSATGTGEAFILAGFAHSIDWAMRIGTTLHDALAGALTAVAAWNGTGGAITLAPSGDFEISFNTPAMARGWCDRNCRVVRI